MKKTLALVAMVSLMTPAALAADTGKVTASALNVRADATLTADILGKLSQGTEVQVEGKVLNDEWCRIMYKNVEAYVACSYLSFATPTTTAPAVETPATPVEEEKEDAPAPTTPAPTTNTTFPLKRFVTVPLLNVRASGSLQGELLGQLKQDVVVDVEAKSQDNWCRITFEGKTAWISCMYLGVPAVTTPATQTPAPETGTGTTMTGTTMPESPAVTTTPVSAGEGCAWEEQDFGALVMKMQKCTTNGVTYGVRGNGVYKFAAGSETPQGDAILELYAKGDAEPVQDAVMSLVSSTIPETEQGKCVVRKVASTLQDASKELYGLVPTEEYQKVIDARLANETNVTACGAYGLGKVTQYFEYHPGESKTIFAFVRLDGSIEPESIVMR